jgi:hypothetical protein
MYRVSVVNIKSHEASSPEALSSIITAGHNLLQAWGRVFAFTEFHAQTTLKTLTMRVRLKSVTVPSSFISVEISPIIKVTVNG